MMLCVGYTENIEGYSVHCGEARVHSFEQCTLLTVPQRTLDSPPSHTIMIAPSCHEHP